MNAPKRTMSLARNVHMPSFIFSTLP